MRVISGTARGTKLYSLEGDNTRPTLDRVKEALFNIINYAIKESIVLDLFSGSGAIGIEAASRGAKKVFLCDQSKKAIEIIQKNVEKTRLKEKCVILQSNYQETIRKIGDKFDFIYIDPPYATDLAKQAVELILNMDKLKEDGLIVIETDEKEKILKQLAELSIEIEVFEQRKYGRVELIFLRKG